MGKYIFGGGGYDGKDMLFMRETTG